MDIQLDCHCVMSETIGPATNYRIVSVMYCPTGTKKWGPASPKLEPSRCEETLMKLTHKFAEMTPEMVAYIMVFCLSFALTFSGLLVRDAWQDVPRPIAPASHKWCPPRNSQTLSGGTQLSAGS